MSEICGLQATSSGHRKEELGWGIIQGVYINHWTIDVDVAACWREFSWPILPPDHYPWSILVVFLRKIGLPVCATLLFPLFLPGSLLAQKEQFAWGSVWWRRLNLDFHIQAQSWILTLIRSCLVSFELSQSLRCQHRAGRCDRDLWETLSCSWRSGSVSWGCWVAVAAHVWAAELKLAIQAPKGGLNSSVTTVCRATPFMLGHADWHSSTVTLWRLLNCSSLGCNRSSHV